jgi:aldose 1-epimerase
MMAAARETFGEFRGQPVERVRLANGHGLAAAVLTWGGVLQDLTLDVDGSPRPLVLGFAEFADYPAKSPYLGATVGRFGNRIGGAAFTLDGERCELDPNERGRNHLHGGLSGWGKRLWDIASVDASSVSLTLSSADGDMGYPGAVEAACTYRLTGDALVIDMTATTTRATPINMVHHSYWNLDGRGSIEAHRLRLDADRYLPTDEEQIPTGEIATVEGTIFDFRELRRIDAMGTADYDHCMVLTEKPDLRQVAEVVSGDGRVGMTLFADQPGVQLYTGFKMDITARGGRRIGPRAGLCLETEAYPDAPNKPQFPSAILRPGETYRHVMEHRFRVMEG